jgi:hypothetical protein
MAPRVLASLGFVLSLSTAPLVSIARASESAPVVRDQQGAVVGTVLGEALDAVALGLGPESLIWMAYPVGSAAVRLLVSETGPFDTKGLEPLLYESADCSGAALIEAPKEPTDVRATVVFATDVFWADGPGAERVIRSRARLVRDPSECDDTPVAQQVCCTSLPRGETRLAAEVTGASLASLRLQPPFHVDGAE